MVEVDGGDIFNSTCEALVNPVNCVGVAGKGLAKEFKARFPDWFKDYCGACLRCELYPGTVRVFDTKGDPRYIISFPTKRHWRQKARYIDVWSGLVALKQEIVQRGIPSVAIPALGCGEGGLDYGQVLEQIIRELKDVKAQVLIYTPQGKGK